MGLPSEGFPVRGWRRLWVSRKSRYSSRRLFRLPNQTVSYFQVGRFNLSAIWLGEQVDEQPLCSQLRLLSFRRPLSTTGPKGIFSGVFPSPTYGRASGTFSLSDGRTETASLVRGVPSRLANISTRGFVGTGENVLIGGFIVTSGGKVVFVDAKGPSLASQGVSSPIQATAPGRVPSGSQVSEIPEEKSDFPFVGESKGDILALSHAQPQARRCVA